jgi:PAS domain-containing protein
MKPVEPPPASQGANAEISALIETLHATGQRLEELTDGEVDGVADHNGRTFLLRHVQEQLRHNDATRQASILNALPAQIALLDSQGRIVSVNQAWQQFVDANALPGKRWGNWRQLPRHLRRARAVMAQSMASAWRREFDRCCATGWRAFRWNTLAIRRANSAGS